MATDSSRPRIDCPKCGSSMARASAGGIEFDRCSRCAGLWLDLFEKDRLSSHKHLAREADTGPTGPGPNSRAKGPFHCPRDGARLIGMVDKDQTHIEFEMCSTCGGVFLDAGELRDLSEHTLIERVRALLH